ncbi:hypothetical protein PMAYCL1PPCAC_00809, partial [Pristionchus mayeri]
IFNGGPIRRVTDPAVSFITPQCILCEIHPKSVAGYTLHLAIHHKSTLKENRIFLMCGCGFRCTSNRHSNHGKKCSGGNFTLHKLDED